MLKIDVEKVKSEMEKAKMTRRGLAKKAGLRPNTICDVLNRPETPRRYLTVSKIIDALELKRYRNLILY